jgi:stearoyl-CoA desaturase (delta-9 desaturase)
MATYEPRPVNVDLRGARDAVLPPIAAGYAARPTAVSRIDWPYAITVVAFHLIAVLAVLPWFFSWTGVILFILGDYFAGVLGINLCYHRLLTHRGFKCSKRFEHFLAILGVLCVQDTPARWVAVHRRHHQHADDEPDPHTPLVSFFWSHVGWLLVQSRNLQRLRLYEAYAKDIIRDPFYANLDRGWNHVKVLLASWLAFFAVGFLAELALGGSAAQAAQFGASLLVWGVFVRTVVVWHQTWAVNSVTHLWGYRNYATDEGSRNNFAVGLLSNGEGWHNNHHADPRAAKHGHRWWEIDTTYMTIRLLQRLGLATDVIMPNPRVAEVWESRQLQTREFQVNPDEAR